MNANWLKCTFSFKLSCFLSRGGSGSLIPNTMWCKLYKHCSLRLTGQSPSLTPLKDSWPRKRFHFSFSFILVTKPVKFKKKEKKDCIFYRKFWQREREREQDSCNIIVERNNGFCTTFLHSLCCMTLSLFYYIFSLFLHFSSLWFDSICILVPVFGMN